jgi:hypothetical protein
MAIDVTSVFAEKLARNRGPHPLDPDCTQASDYAVSASIEGTVLTVRLTFRAGVAYCCFESGCHLALFSGKRWDGLRRALAAQGVVAPQQLELQLFCVIEEGALSFDIFKPDPTRRGWYAFESASKQQYDVSELEANI